MAKNNPAAQLALMRAASLTPERRREIAIKASKAAADARKKKISPERRSEIARKAGKAGGRGRAKKADG